MVAAERGNTRVVLELLSRGAEINMQDNYGNTALHLAAKNVHYFYVLLFFISRIIKLFSMSFFIILKYVIYILKITIIKQ